MMEENFFENRQINKIYSLAAKKTISHALLFESDNKDLCISVAINVAKILMCQNGGNNACGNCDSCKKISSNIHPDIEFIQPQSNQKTIGIDTIRTLKQNAYITPNESDYKIYIFPDSSIITPQAQNAFLKILEEPPKSVIFMMVCQNKSKLLNTIISRLTCFKISSNENQIEDGILSAAKKLIENLINKNELEILKILSNFSKNRSDFIKLLKCLKNLIIQNLASNNKYNLILDSIKTVKILDNLEKCENLTEKNINMSLLPCYLCLSLISILN